MSNNNSGKIKLSKYAYFEFNKNLVVCLNQRLGLWLKISKECYDLIMHAVKDNQSIDEFVALFLDNEDKEYILKVIHKLQHIQVIIDENDEEKNKLESVDIMVTERCNLSCKHCAAEASNPDGIEYFNTIEMKKILDKIMDCKPETLVITGGEPLLRDDIFEIMRYAKSRGEVGINLMTNGTLISESNIEEIAELVDTIDISIDGYDEESCSHIRGTGVFDRVLKNIDLVKKRTNIPIALSMVVVERNELEELKFKNLCEKIGVKNAIRRLSYSGRAKENWDYLHNTNKMEAPIPSNLKRENPSYTELKSALKASICKGGTSSLSINARGDIYPCAAFSEIVGRITNIKQIESLNEFINSEELVNSNAMKKLMEYSPYYGKICSECNVKSFCWTCPHAAYEIMSEEELFKKVCKPKKEYLQKLVWGTSF